jgi:anaerobic magnesium-protoporphyrin IX monomethyl ester cyclase
MNKDFQDFPTIYESAARCLAAGNSPILQHYLRLPGRRNKRAQRDHPFRDGRVPAFPGAEFWTNIFTPYPGAPIMDKVAELGIQTPDSLEGWVDFFPRYTKLPWLNGRDHQELQVMRDYLRIAFDRIPSRRTRASPLPGWRRNASRCLHAGVSTTTLTAFPVELWLNKKLKETTAALKPAVDAKRLEPNAVEATC